MESDVGKLTWKEAAEARDDNRGKPGLTQKLPFQMLTHRWSGFLGDQCGLKAASHPDSHIHTSAEF